MSLRLTTSTSAGQARRDLYYARRREGLPVMDAAQAAGVTDFITAARYERWWQAVESGALVVPARTAVASARTSS